MDNGFSGVVRISNISDFIAPSTNCVISTEQNVTKQDISQPQVYFKDKGADTNSEDNKKKAIKISLNDCLACSGCITSSETVLVNEQSLARLLEGLNDKQLSVVTVSPQSVCSIAAKRSLTISDAARLIASYFTSKGVNYVVDSSFGRQLALKLTFEEFISSKSRPILSSACPGFVCYAEKTYGKLLLPYISRVRSPQAVHGALVKDFLSRKLRISPKHIFHATVMPCFDKKLEASRADFLISGTEHRETDCVISTAELVLDLNEAIPVCETNLPIGWLGDFGRGNLIGDPGTSSSGGYADYIINQLVSRDNLPVNNKQITKNLNVTEIGHPEQSQIRIAHLYGFKNIQNFVRKIKSGKCLYDYVEIMACPSGCSNGGGQIRGNTTEERETLLATVEKLYQQMDSNRTEEMQATTLEWSRLNPEWRSLVFTEYHALDTNSRPNLQW